MLVDAFVVPVFARMFIITVWRRPCVQISIINFFVDRSISRNKSHYEHNLNELLGLWNQKKMWKPLRECSNNFGACDKIPKSVDSLNSWQWVDERFHSTVKFVHCTPLNVRVCKFKSNSSLKLSNCAFIHVAFTIQHCYVAMHTFEDKWMETPGSNNGTYLLFTHASDPRSKWIRQIGRFTFIHCMHYFSIARWHNEHPTRGKIMIQWKPNLFQLKLS